MRDAPTDYKYKIELRSCWQWASLTTWPTLWVNRLSVCVTHKWQTVLSELRLLSWGLFYFPIFLSPHCPALFGGFFHILRWGQCSHLHVLSCPWVLIICETCAEEFRTVETKALAPPACLSSTSLERKWWVQLIACRNYQNEATDTAICVWVPYRLIWGLILQA